MRPPPLVAITPGDHGAGRDVGAWLAVLGGEGLAGVLVREPQLTATALTRLVDTAQKVVPWVAVHDGHPGARDLGLPVHLPGHVPGNVSVGERSPPSDRSWGRSCHTLGEVDAALGEGADWTLWSPVWRPTSKPADRRPPLGLYRFVEGARGRAVWALGGVTPDRFAQLLEAGAAGAAVLGDLFRLPDAGAASARCREYLAQLASSNRNRASYPS